MIFLAILPVAYAESIQISSTNCNDTLEENPEIVLNFEDGRFTDGVIVWNHPETLNKVVSSIDTAMFDSKGDLVMWTSLDETHYLFGIGEYASDDKIILKAKLYTKAAASSSEDDYIKLQYNLHVKLK